ncbi:hypothetical protein A5791_12825 [Mycobacterium sp. 852002-51163_SCH5372311]|uniref:BTAD domain-containing putative transcriptional regulator n=1 Tax=Mycobacterium sp. 852002-51163_SCH5372311 TaxID=1834097 RepID=UPI0007FC9EE2|nr:hypothetical protein A5791_12825 [Mycobacterium sp. 852002-51163_SCH5372311]
MLALHDGSVVAADSLVELLWGEDPPRTAAKALPTHISTLRRTLGDGFVLTEGAGWTLADSEVDASRYKAAARLGRAAAAAGDTGQAVARFEEALALWRGIPELPDSRRGASEKTQWIEGHAALVEDRADALLLTGRAAEIIGELEAAVADAPLRERRWGQLMLALYRAGRQGEALGAYQRARTLLADELGVDPGPDLRRLEAAIVAQDTALEIPAAQQPSTVTRAVTFLLTDIEGSTAAWEADAGAMAAALARHDELVEQVVTSRGGRLIKTRGEGDATFSVFERPSTAAAAAIELQEAIVHEPWALREPMRIRVALHTGEAELRDGDYFGRAVNRAARLRSLAEGGQILCSGATAELVIDSLADDVELADLGMRQLKNLARPEHVFELRLATAELSPPVPANDAPIDRPDLPAVLGGPGPFVGRGPELEGLFSAWQRALAGGTNAVLIAGEPGVGKTRLAGEWSRQAYDQGALVIYGRCDEDLGAPYQPFAEALRSLVPCLGANGLRGLRGVEALLALVPGLTDVLPDLAAPTRADPDTERYALFDAVVALLGIASARAPVVLILDDLHWAAKPTLLLLRHLLRFGERDRVQIVGTYRSTDLDRSHPLAAMLADLHRSVDSGTANRIALGGLNEDDVTEYVAEAGFDDEELARALASVTGGNPFFLIEALRHVDESGGHWDPSTLPQGVREAVSRRLTRLPAETNKALAAAAVVGSRFGLELVERVVGDDLVDAFDEACKAGIVIEESSGHYRFNHALVRQSLLAELPSVRRLRLHQRIATTLETEAGADDELLAELAYHYFECAWAGNAAKAVEYCRRAADQAMARLAYEGAADLYDRALHALEEIDDELPDRDDQVAALTISRCEALLAAGDVISAASAVAQLQEATRDSARLAAWATCFDGQLSMLIHPERLDEVEAAVGAAAGTLSALDDAAGEAMAHTVRAGCLARLGRIGDCEIALDDALTAARRAREHRRVNAVLANAPLAALWGPNPVPRAGGRCLDVVRLLRITTDSPAVEATSTRCQAVLEAFRGRAEAARRMIDSARRTVTELGLRHALLEVEQFAGIVELVAADPAAAEAHLRQAYNGFRRMGLDADTAETAALLGRTCLALDRADEADELCRESERLAGHALKPSIAWRSLRAHLLSRGNDHDGAQRAAEAAVALAERTDLLVDHGDACASLATVLGAAGNDAGARAAAERAVGLYERKGAAALAEMAREILGAGRPSVPAPPEPPRQAEPDNACVRAVGRLDDAVDREAWDEVEQQFATDVHVESRRKVVGYPRVDLSPRGWIREVQRARQLGMVRQRHAVVAVRGDRLALTRVEVGTADVSPGAPQDELLRLIGLDEDGRIELLLWFDVEDMDAAVAELDAAHARQIARAPQEDPSAELDNACVRVIRESEAAANRDAWEEVERIYAPDVFFESRRKVIGFTRDDLPPGAWADHARRLRDSGPRRARIGVIATRGERLALTRLELFTEDESPGAPHDEALQLYGIDNEGRISLQVVFDIDDIDAAVAELAAAHARFEETPPEARALENAASRTDDRANELFTDHRWDELDKLFADDLQIDDRRRGLRRQGGDRATELANMRAIADIGVKTMASHVLAIRGERLALTRTVFSGRDDRPEAFRNELLRIAEIDTDGLIVAMIAFDLDDLEAAYEELEARYLAGEAAPYARVWQIGMETLGELNRHEPGRMIAELVYTDHRHVPFAPGDFGRAVEELWALIPDARYRTPAVYALDTHGMVAKFVIEGTDVHGNELQWPRVLLLYVGRDETRLDVYEEDDVDAALARFEELRPQALRLENAASQAVERYMAHFAARDWDSLAKVLADDMSTDDRRRVVNTGIRSGRDAEIANLRAAADVGITYMTSVVIAARGERLILTRTSGGNGGSEEFLNDVVGVVEINSHNQIAAIVVFDADDLQAALAELDARYIAGEAASYARAWSLATGAFAAINRHELPELAPDWANIDHRRGAAFAPGDMTAFVHDLFGDSPDINVYIEAVHRISNLGVVVTQRAHGTSQNGFQAEWREVGLFTFDGDLLSRCELFDETDLDAAIARFDQLSRPTPRLENAASQVYERCNAYFAAHDWDALAATFADDISTEDRRRVVGIAVGHGRDAVIATTREIVDVGMTNLTSSVIAIRGNRLVLARARFSGPDQEPGAFHTDVLIVLESNADNRIAAHLVFDPDDFEAALAELDARYLAGEAADHARTWAVVSGTFASVSRNELPAHTPYCTTIDHRRVTAFAPGELNAYIRAGCELDQTVRTYVEVVHRLSGLGAVCTFAAHGGSREGFDAEWRGVSLSMVDGDLVNRSELFDETELDAAIAKFDQLSRPAPRLENAASRAIERFQMCFTARDWDTMAEMMAEDVLDDDRRRVVNAGVRHGRDAEIANMQAIADIGTQRLSSTVIATRGERLVLRREHVGNDELPEAFQFTDVLQIVELDADERFAAVVTFDLNQIDAAFEELDDRYLAGEAAEHAHTWSVITRWYAALNRHEIPPTTPDWVNTDHRRGRSFEAGDLPAFLRATWELVPQARIYIEAVHRLSNFGALVTQASQGTSPDGFDAEWREISMKILDGDLVSRSELFDETDLDTAITRFEELQPPIPRLQNAATQVAQRFWSSFVARDWDGMTELLADDLSTEDRRRVVSAGTHHGRHFDIGNMRAVADIGVTNAMLTVIATRGMRLALSRVRLSGRDQRPDAFHTEALGIAEIDDDGRLIAHVAFDPDDFDAAFAELEARYLAGEAAKHSQTWSVIVRECAAFNRHELPPADWVTIDHRPVAPMDTSDLQAAIRAIWDLTPDLTARIEAVHRLSGFGAVVTYTAHGISTEGFAAEWRMIEVLTVEGDQLNRSEFFDEAHLDAALARFEELHSQAPQRLTNAVSQRFLAHFANRDWAAMAQDFAEDYYQDDRRRAVNSGLREGRDAAIEDLRAAQDVGFTNVTLDIIATRGEHLILTRWQASGRDPEAIRLEVHQVVEIDADERFAACIVFDLDDVDAAFEELDARYLAGEAATHAHTWSVITSTYAAFNQHELSRPDWVVIDHRPGALFASSNLPASVHAFWDQTPDLSIRIEAVHRLSDFGAVVTHTADGTSPDGFAAEWRMIQVLTIEGDQVCRCELFDEEDVGAALARFDELHAQATRLENAASRITERCCACFSAQDWSALAELLADDMILDDRRRVVNAGIRQGRDLYIADNRAAVEAGAEILSSRVIATRGERLALTHARAFNRGFSPGEVGAEWLAVAEIDVGKRIVAIVAFDLDDIDAAFEELDTRYLAGEAAAHERTWSVIARECAAFNRHELTAVDYITVDHRPLPIIEALSQAAVRVWDVTPDFGVHIEAVHRLSDFGAVATYQANGTSLEGFDAEWRMIELATVEGDRINRCEVFDESNLDAALARFEELQHQAPRLNNAASQVIERYQACFTTRNWAAFAQLLADDVVADDRRHVVNAGVRRGRDLHIADMQATVEVSAPTFYSSVIATRGEQLALAHVRIFNRGMTGEVGAEALGICEIDADERMAAMVTFDTDDLDAAFAELDARYLAGEAAAHSRTWSVIARAQAAGNRRELPPTATDSVYIDHRPVVRIEAVDAAASLRAMWDLAPEISFYIEAVHQLSEFGAVVTQVLKGTSQEGFDAEWRTIDVFKVEGDLISRCEVFDEADVDTALARFEELQPQAPRLENAASQMVERYFACFSARDWSAMAKLLADDIVVDDRRRVVNAGIRQGRDLYIADNRAAVEVGAETIFSSIVATRGERLALAHIRSVNRGLLPGELGAEMLGIAEIDADHRIIAAVVFDLDDIDAAYEELDARYLAGEAAAHAHTWSVIVRERAAFNRHELTAVDYITVDHRPLPIIEAFSQAALRVWDVTPDFGIHIEAVHRLSDFGAVATYQANGTSLEGFDGEWRIALLVTVEGDRINRCEVFEDADLDAALARFEKLQSEAPRPENAATQVAERLRANFAARDWAARAELLAEECSIDDRRRTVNAGNLHGRDADIANMRAIADLGVANIALKTIATRGERLALCRARMSGRDQRPEAFYTETLTIIEIDTDNRAAAQVVFDPEDIDAALAELEARYLAGEAAAHAPTWSVIAGAYAGFNRHELPPMTTDSVSIDHRRLVINEAVDLTVGASSVWDVAPDLHVHIEAVHQLSEIGAVVTHVGQGTSPDGFDAEWRMVNVFTVDGDLLNRCEIFDEEDLDAALARFDELQPQVRQLENAASQVSARLLAHFATGDWDAMAEMLADDFFRDDRRRVVGAGIGHGRDGWIVNMRATADLWLANVTSTVIATRGERLVLLRGRFSHRGQVPDGFITEYLSIIELNADEQITAIVMIDLDDIDAAFEELDARYLAGEAAVHSQTWSVIARACATLNRREIPATTAEFADIDHRQVAAIGSGDLKAYIRASFDLTVSIRTYVEAVHRLSDLGAVVTYVATGTSQEGFDAEWRMTDIFTVEGELISRCEIFDEADIAAALARFDELDRRAPPLDNAATRTWARLTDAFNRRDVDGCLALTTADFRYEDRRKGLRDLVEGPAIAKAAQAMFETPPTSVQATVEPLAIRGSRLSLTRFCYRDTDFPDGPIIVESLQVTGVSHEGLMQVITSFDPDDINGAMAELTDRWIASGEVAHPEIIVSVQKLTETLNRHDWDAFAKLSDGATFINHRQLSTPGVQTIADNMTSFQMMASLVPDYWVELAEVLTHSAMGAVNYVVLRGTSTDGAAIEIPLITLTAFDSERVTRFEAFDADQRELALARFEELGLMSQPH